MKIQVDLPEEINKKLKIAMIEKGYKNLGETLIKILGEALK